MTLLRDRFEQMMKEKCPHVRLERLRFEYGYAEGHGKKEWEEFLDKERIERSVRSPRQEE